MINRDLLPDNGCYGCGHGNPEGLRIELHRAGDDELRGTFTPREAMVGFPGIVHGGAVYTALDCLACWAGMALRAERKSFWLTRTGAVKYHRPARQGRPLALHARVLRDEGALTVAVEARDERGDVVVDGEFKVVPVPPDRFMELMGIDELPENWRSALS